MSGPLAGRVAIVTGGSRGIGRAICLRLAADGANVVVNYNANADKAEEVVREVKKAGQNAQAMAVQANAASVKDVGRLVDETVSKFGRIDIVVAAAAVLKITPMAELTEEEYDEHMNVNVKGPVFMVQKAAEHMKEGGRVILFSSATTIISSVNPGYLAYCASKGAIEQAVRLMNKNLAPRGIMVNAVAPGPTATDMFFAGKTQEHLEMMRNTIPQKKFGEPQQIADVVGFMASDASGWVGGQVLHVNGGQA